MSENEEWSEWFQHDGSGYAVPRGMVAMIQLGNGQISTYMMVWARPGWSSWDWSQAWFKVWPERAVVRYRIRKPRGLTILEDLIADLPAPVGPKVDA